MKEEFIKMLEDWLDSRPDDAFKKAIKPFIRTICESGVKLEDIDTGTALGHLVYYTKQAIDQFEDKMLGKVPNPTVFLPDPFESKAKPRRSNEVGK